MMAETKVHNSIAPYTASRLASGLPYVGDLLNIEGEWREEMSLDALRKAFPDNAPIGDDVDFRWLSRKLKLTGGNIKNISLRAAFLAIERHGVIGMRCLIDASESKLPRSSW